MIDESAQIRHLALELDQCRYIRNRLKAQLRTMRQDLRQTRAELRRVHAELETLRPKVDG